MGRYSERYWDDDLPGGALFGIEIRYGCEITDSETGLVGTTYKSRSSKTKAHDDAWEDLMEKQREYYEIQAEREKELRDREYARRATGEVKAI